MGDEAGPTPGLVRQVAGPGGEAAGVEVWTGREWLRLQHVRHVSAVCQPHIPNIGPAVVTFGAVMPAGLPLPERRVAPR